MERDAFEDLVGQGLSIREISARLGLTAQTVERWLKEFGMETEADVRRRQLGKERRSRRSGVCEKHGVVVMVARAEGGWRCVKCRSEAVRAARRRRKLQLVAEAGGACVVCGYQRCIGAFEFHHVDPVDKRFALGARGVTRSLARAREEAAKCVLLCSNCHAEVESGLLELPIK